MKQLYFIITFFLYSGILCAQQTIIWAQDGHPDGLQVNSVVFSPDGTRILSGTNCHPAKLRLFDAVDGNLVWDYTLAPSFECMMSVGMSANNQYIATAEETGKLMLFDYTQNPPTLASVLDLGTTYAFSVDFSPNSEKVAIGASNGKLRTYSLPSGTPDLNINAHPGSWVMSVDYSSDNTRIVTGGSDNKIKIFDTTSGAVLSTLTGHTNDVVTVKFTPDNQRIVSGSLDKTVKVWDVSTGTLLHTFDASTEVVNAVDISPDGAFIVAVANDELVSIWSLNDYSEITSFSLAPNGSALSVSWSPVAPQIVCGTVGSKVVLIDISESVSGVKTSDYEGSLHISPSPFSTYFSVSFPDKDIATIQLFDNLGTLITEADHLSSQELYTFHNIKNLPAGTYVVRLITSDNRVVIRKVIKSAIQN